MARLPVSDPNVTEMGPSAPPPARNPITDEQVDVVEDQVGEPDKDGFGKRLLSVGLPAGLAVLAGAIGKQHGLGVEGAVAFLSGMQQGSSQAAQIAHAQALQQRQMALQEQQERRIATDPFLGSMGQADLEREYQTRTGQAPVGKLMSPTEQRLQAMAFDAYGKWLGSANPMQASKGLLRIGEMTGSGELVQLGQLVQQAGTEALAELKPFIGLLVETLKDQGIPNSEIPKIVASPLGQQYLHDFLETRAKALGDPMTAAQMGTEASRQKANEALAVERLAGAEANRALAAQRLKRMEQIDQAIIDAKTTGKDPMKVALQIASNQVSGLLARNAKSLSGRFDSKTPEEQLLEWQDTFMFVWDTVARRAAGMQVALPPPDQSDIRQQFDAWVQSNGAPAGASELEYEDEMLDQEF